MQNKVLLCSCPNKISFLFVDLYIVAIIAMTSLPHNSISPPPTPLFYGQK